MPPDQLDHMAPKRGKWTSPPPPEASEADRTEFEGKLGESLALATAATNARQQERDLETSSTISSEVITDDDDQRSDMAESVDDVRSTRSYSEDGVLYFNRHQVSPSTPIQQTHFVQDPSSSRSSGFVVQTPDGSVTLEHRLASRLRGRTHRLAQQVPDAYAANLKQHQNYNT